MKLWNENRRTELGAYCMDDVRLTAKLALLPRMRMADLWIPQQVYGIGPALAASALSAPDSDTN